MNTSNLILWLIIIIENSILLYEIIYEKYKQNKQKSSMNKQLVAKKNEYNQKVTFKPRTAYDRIMSYCDDETLALHTFEKINNIPIGTIIRWQNKPPEMKEIVKAAIYMKVSPIWLETGKHIEGLSIKEEFILYILRHMNNEQYDHIINESIHEAFEEIEKIKDV